MNCDIFDINKFIQVNNLKEVTNPILLERDNIPTSDGLLSYEIFGRTSDERSNIFAYIDLHGHFLHPLVYKTWKRMSRAIEGVVSGTVNVIVNASGELEPNPDGWSGLEQLYKHFNELKFPVKTAVSQKERADFLRSLKREEAFVDKWLVLPPFYRDIQLDKANMGKVSVHEKTKMYANLLRMSKALMNDVSGIPIVGDSTRNRIQSLLVECYTDHFMQEIKGKDGMFRKFVLGKSVDYGVRLVISSPIFDADRPQDMQVTYEKSGVPLAACCVCFFPYFIKWLKDYFNREVFLLKDKYPVMRKDKSVEYVKLLNVEQYNDEYFTKMIDLFINSFGDRFKTIPLENDKGYNIKMSIIGQRASIDNNPLASTDSTIMKRALTITDLLYMAAVDICKDKHVLVTRYPLEDYFGIFPCKIEPLSTIETGPVMISGRLYPFYPKIDTSLSKSQVSNLFRDTLCISNLYLKGLGGDYDGDQVTVRGVWDVNANRKCHQNMYAKKNFLNISGKLIRSTEKEAVQTIYSLSASPKDFTKYKPVRG